MKRQTHCMEHGGHNVPNSRKGKQQPLVAHESRALQLECTASLRGLNGTSDGQVLYGNLVGLIEFSTGYNF